MIDKARKYAFGAFSALFFILKDARDNVLAIICVVMVMSLLAVAVSVGTYTLELREFRRTFIVDLDLARKQFADELVYLYMQGCLDGTNWTNKPAIPTTGFNTNSSQFYCTGQLEYRQQYILEKTVLLGKAKNY